MSVEINVLKTLKGRKYYDKYCKYHKDGTALKECLLEIDIPTGIIELQPGEAICRAPRGYRWRRTREDESDCEDLEYDEKDEVCNHRSRDRAGLTDHLKKVHRLDGQARDKHGNIMEKKGLGFKAFLGNEENELESYYKAIIKATDNADQVSDNEDNTGYDEGEGTIEIPRYKSGGKNHKKGELNLKQMLKAVTQASGQSPCLSCAQAGEVECLNRANRACKSWKLFAGGLVARRAYVVTDDA